jgi:hypothetical protein
MAHGRKSKYMAMKAGGPFREWAGRLAARSRLTFSALMERLLVEHAERSGFPDPPPPRMDPDGPRPGRPRKVSSLDSGEVPGG